jgi:hypothetical protein
MPKQKGKASALLLSRYITAISYKLKRLMYINYPPALSAQAVNRYT